MAKSKGYVGQATASGDRIRIAIVISSFEIGGAELQAINLANGLEQRRFYPMLICWSGHGPLRALVGPAVAVIDLHIEPPTLPAVLRRPIWGFLIFASLVSHFRRNRPVIIHAFMWSTYVLAAFAALLSRPSIVIAARRGLVSNATYGVAGRLLGSLANHNIALHLCNSEAVRNLAITNEGIPRAKTAVIRNGVPAFQAGEETRAPDEWALAHGGRSAACLANFHRYKGHTVLLGAARRVVSSYPAFRLVLIGDGPERGSILELSRRMGLSANVIFAGRVSNARRVLPNFDFTILPSFEEGLPNAVMESMAAGVPVIASNVGGVPELITDKVDGLLIPPGDEYALANAISWMLIHPVERARMGRAAKARMLTDFAPETMIRQTEAVYDELLNSAAPTLVRTREL